VSDDCLFCRIIRGEIPAKFVAKTPECVAFRDIDPQAPTHILLVPTTHYGNAAEMATDDPQGLAALIVTAGILYFGTDEERFRAAVRRGLERTLSQFQDRAPADTSTPAPSRPDLRGLIELLALALPPAAAVLATITSLINLWIAERVVKISGRLRRPPPDLSAMRFPVYAPALTAIAVAVSFVPGMLGLVSGVFGASLLMAYAILGFAVLHAITRGMGSRPFALGGIYVAVIVFGWPLLAMTLLGLADSAVDLRGRAARRRPPPNPGH